MLFRSARLRYPLSVAVMLLQSVGCPGISQAEVGLTSETEMLLPSVGGPGTSKAEVSLKRGGDAAPVCRVSPHQRRGGSPYQRG